VLLAPKRILVIKKNTRTRSAKKRKTGALTSNQEIKF
jgi:hypothetical protein